MLLQAPAQPRSYAPVTNTKDNPPCNTLFIGNLSEHTSEDELRGIFQSQPGTAPLSWACYQKAGWPHRQHSGMELSALTH